MQITEKPSLVTKFNVTALSGLLVLSALALPVQAAEQPAPGPEHKKMEVAVGQWAYEGSAESSPFGPAGKFKGTSTSRMVLGGFYLETREEDTSDDGYIYQGIYLQGYDPLTRTYFTRGFVNDGTATLLSTSVTGNTWTSTGTRTDNKGKAHKTRDVLTYSSDGQSFTFAAEYSADDGNTWLPLWKGTMKRVKK
jgi:hypothetical protein